MARYSQRKYTDKKIYKSKNYWESKLKRFDKDELEALIGLCLIYQINKNEKTKNPNACSEHRKLHLKCPLTCSNRKIK